MATVLTRLFALLLGSFFLTASTSFQGLLLAVRGGAEGFPTFSLGLLGTTWAIGFVAGCILVPRLVRRVGHIRAFGVMATVSAIVVLLNVLLVDPWFWVMSRAFSGFCMAGAFMVIESWLNERASAQNRGSMFAIYMIILTLGYTTGQLGLGALDPMVFAPFVIAAIGYCLAILPTALSTSAVPRPLTETRIDIKAIRETSPVAAFSIVCIGLANGAYGTLAPVYAQQIGLTTTFIAFFMSAGTIGGALSQLPIGRLSDSMDRRYVIAGVGLAAALMSLVFIASGGGEGTVPVFMALFYGILIFPMYSVAVAHANDVAAPDSYSQTASTLLLLYGVGTMIGPALASASMNLFGPSGLFMFTGAIQLAIFAYAVWRVTQYGRTIAEKTPFAPIAVPRAQTPETFSLMQADPIANEGQAEPPATDGTETSEPPHSTA